MIDPELWILVHGGPYAVEAMTERPDWAPPGMQGPILLALVKEALRLRRDADMEGPLEEFRWAGRLLRRLSLRADLPADALARLLREAPWGARLAAARNPRTPSGALQEAWDEAEQAYLGRRGRRLLQADKAVDLMAALAANPNAPSEVLRGAAFSTAADVRGAAYVNPQMPEKIFLEAAEVMAQAGRFRDLGAMLVVREVPPSVLRWVVDHAGDTSTVAHAQMVLRMIRDRGLYE